MEKRRRARINESLNELKKLILEAMRKDVSVIWKLADKARFQLQKYIPVKYLTIISSAQLSDNLRNSFNKKRKEKEKNLWELFL